MNGSTGARVAAVWLPLPDTERLEDPSLARWLYRGDLDQLAGPIEPLDAVAGLLGATVPASGRASLRFFGQTGDTPSIWMAGADPVYLEPRLDHLFLHAFVPGDISASEYQGLFDHLQGRLATSGDFAFARVGAYGYLRANAPMASATLSTLVVNQRVPGEYMPAGPDAAGYRQRLSEIEMTLHEHAVNEARVERGQFPVNSLWLWGGGTLPDVEVQKLPPLFCNDPLLVGFWKRAGASLVPLPVSIPEIIDITDTGFVTMIPLAPASEPLLEPSLAALRAALWSGRLDEVRLHFANDLKVTLRRSHRHRYWRRSSPVPELERNRG